METTRDAVGWAVVITKPMAEYVASKHIRQAGYREYVPSFRKVLRGHRSTKGEEVMRPLFTRYLFAELHPGQQWTPLMRATGVQDLIWWGQKPALLPSAVVEAIREAENGQQFDDRPKPLNAGDLVRVVNGPFATFLATVSSADENGKVLVLLNMLGGIRRATINALDLEAASA